MNRRSGLAIRSISWCVPGWGLMSADNWGAVEKFSVPVNLVLIVEDDLASAESTGGMLEQHHVSVRIAKDGGQRRHRSACTSPISSSST